MTAGPKADKITAALGPAMKLAKSTIFSPEKMLSLAMFVSPESCAALSSAPLKPGRALCQEGGRALLLVRGCGAKSEVGSLEQQPFALARLHSLVSGLERKLDGDRRVGGDLFEDCLGTRDQISGRNDLVDEPDAIGLLRADHLSGKNEVQGAAFSDQPRPRGIRPSLTSGWPNFAFSTAIRMVQAIAVSQPPPSANPLTAAITGLPRSSIRSRTSWPKRLDCSASNAVTRASSLMSAPAMNALLPAPVRMTPRTAASSRASSNAVRRSAQVALFSALSTLGRLTVT